MGGMPGRGAAGPGQLYSGCYVETGEYYVSSAFVYPTTHVPPPVKSMPSLFSPRRGSDATARDVYVTLVFRFITDGNIGLS
jgi:hypothetical protein